MKSCKVNAWFGPSNPDQTCSVSNDGGTLSGMNVSNVQVSCLGFLINPGLNDAWYDPVTDGQGFFIVPIQRVTDDNIALCEALLSQ